MATVYSDRGHGIRPPVVFYNRSNEAARSLKPGDFNWKEIFAGGVRWFHSGGIFAALSETTGELIIEAMQAAKEAGAIVSFDLNFRAKLWKIFGGDNRAVAVIDRIVKNVDVLVGNEEDLQKGLGIPGPEVAAKSKLDPSAFFGMMDNVLQEASAHQEWLRPRCAKSTPPTVTAGARWPGSTARPIRRPQPISTWSIASAAATAMQPASSTAC